MFAIKRVILAAAVVVFVVMSSARSQQPAANERTVRQNLGKALHDALQAEREPPIRLMMAEALIRVAPDDASAAKELVETMNNGSENLPAEAYLAMSRVISESPPALVTALIPLLKSQDDATRQRVVALLIKVDPKALP